MPKLNFIVSPVAIGIVVAIDGIAKKETLWIIELITSSESNTAENIKWKEKTILLLYSWTRDHGSEWFSLRRYIIHKIGDD